MSWLGEMQFVAAASPVLQRMVGSGSGSGFQPCAGLHAAVRCCWTPVLSLPSGFLGTHVPALNILNMNIFPCVVYLTQTLCCIFGAPEVTRVQIYGSLLDCNPVILPAWDEGTIWVFSDTYTQTLGEIESKAFCSSF